MPTELSITPYNTGGALCSSGKSVAWVCRTGNTLFEIACPDDCSTWSNSAHCGPRRVTKNGTPVPRPKNAIGYVRRAWDTINGGRRWTSIVAPTAREAAQIARHLGVALAQCDPTSFSSQEERREFKRRAFAREPLRHPQTEGRHWHWARHLEALRVFRAGCAAARGLWQPDPPRYEVGWQRRPALP